MAVFIYVTFGHNVTSRSRVTQQPQDRVFDHWLSKDATCLFQMSVNPDHGLSLRGTAELLRLLLMQRKALTSLRRNDRNATPVLAMSHKWNARIAIDKVLYTCYTLASR